MMLVGELLLLDAKMSQVYVLMEHGWEYNDEVYFQGAGGNPKLVFTSKKV